MFMETQHPSEENKGRRRRPGQQRTGQQSTKTALTMAEIWTTVGSTIASFMFVSAIIRQYCPYELRRFLEKSTHRLMGFFNPYIRVSIHEFTGTRLKCSEAYAAVEAYLSANSSKSAKRLKAEVGKDSKKIVLSMDEYEKVTDEFQGVQISWASSKTVSPQRPMGYGHYPEPERRFYKLTFHKRYREMITESYLEHVIKKGKEIRVKNRQRKLYTNGPTYRWPSHKQTMWSHIPFEHPATFETMAMEPEKKQEIVEDLLTFTQSKDFYARIGKVWKRGYLLYGPPGTGKSTMIAAMANLLNYDVYDLELTAVKDNTELRKLLIETTSKSIIVIEDIDCSLDLTGQRKKKTEKVTEDKNEQGKKDAHLKEPKEESFSRVTLSGLLNFIDDIWSASGGERIIVFTTNYVEKLDPALIRRGRMDKHIELSYCGFEGFKVLAKNYLLVEAHPLFESIQRLMEETKITPADVAEALMPKSPREDAEKCLSNLIRALEDAKKEAATMKDKEESKAKEPAKEDSNLIRAPAEAKKDKEESKSKEPAKEDTNLIRALEEAKKEDANKKDKEESKVKEPAKENSNLIRAPVEAKKDKEESKAKEPAKEDTNLIRALEEAKKEDANKKDKEESKGSCTAR